MAGNVGFQAIIVFVSLLRRFRFGRIFNASVILRRCSLINMQYMLKNRMSYFVNTVFRYYISL